MKTKSENKLEKPMFWKQFLKDINKGGIEYSETFPGEDGTQVYNFIVKDTRKKITDEEFVEAIRRFENKEHHEA